MTDEYRDSMHKVIFWSAPAERSGDGAFGAEGERPGELTAKGRERTRMRKPRQTAPPGLPDSALRTPHCALVKAVSRSACHRTPKWAALAAVLSVFWAADRACAQNLAPAMAPNAYWTSVASSADGTVLTAAASWGGGDSGRVYVSTNGGAAWSVPALPCRVWSSLACSPDGTTLAAAAFDPAPTATVGDSIYISTNSGQSWWPSSAPTRQWTSVVFSGDGARLVGFGYDVPTGMNDLYVSVDSGRNWTSRTLPGISGFLGGLFSLASSGDGAALAGVLAYGGGLQVGPVYTSTNYGVSWRPTAVYASWVAVSADGTHLLAVGSQGVYASTNSGWSWTSNTYITNFAYYSCCAMSADGIHLVVASGAIYTSTNSGVTWTTGQTLASPWEAVASSVDGTRLVGAMQSGGIYVSGDGGATWADVSEPQVVAVATSAPPSGWQAIACSANGTNLVAFEAPDQSPRVGQIYTSRDRGANWTLTSAHADQWTALASSADGSKLVAVAGASATNWSPQVLAANSGQIISSADFGTNWARTSAPIRPWASVACSTNGGQLVAATYDGAIYVSTNSAATWTLTSAPSNLWWAVAMSADGGRIAVAPYNGPIYVSTNAGATWTPTGPSQPPAWSEWKRQAVTWTRWYGLAMSGDGAKLAAFGLHATYLSGDGGATWQQGGGSSFFSCAAFSADGTKLAAGGGPGLFVSADSGATWTLVATTPFPGGSVSCVASSADGSTLVMGGPATVSTNGAYGADNGLILVAQILYPSRPLRCTLCPPTAASACRGRLQPQATPCRRARGSTPQIGRTSPRPPKGCCRFRQMVPAKTRPSCRSWGRPASFG